jgi:hypothetical protein
MSTANRNPKGRNQHTPKPESGDNVSQQDWLPPKWAWAYVRSCLDVDVAPRDAARAKAAGIDRTTLWKALKDPRFVAWSEEQIQKQLSSEHREVRRALLKKCVSGDTDSIRLWHELYGDYIPTSRQIVDGNINFDKVGDRELSEIARILTRGDSKDTGTQIH